MKGAKEDDTSRSIGRVIHEYRTDMDLSQLALAHESGMDPSTISWLENGRAYPSLVTLIKLESVLGTYFTRDVIRVMRKAVGQGG